MQRHYPGSMLSLASGSAIKRITAGCEGPPLTVACEVSICWPGLHPPAKSVSNEKRILFSCREREAVTFNRSEQEFVRSGILRGFLDFLKNDVFGVRDGHTLRFQQQIAHVLVAASPVDQHADVAFDGLDDSEAHLGPAIIHNSVEVLDQRLGEFLKRGQTLPPQLIDPLPQIIEHRSLVAVIP